MKNVTAEISQNELVVMNKLEVKPDAVKTFLEVVGQFSNATRLELGNISFDLFEVLGKNYQYTVFERYVNKEAFELHLATDYSNTCFSALPDLITHPMQEHLVVVGKVEF